MFLKYSALPLLVILLFLFIHLNAIEIILNNKVYKDISCTIEETSHTPQVSVSATGNKKEFSLVARQIERVDLGWPSGTRFISCQDSSGTIGEGNFHLSDNTQITIEPMHLGKLRLTVKY